jgi:aspartyl-tRNA synthetase
MEIGGGSIIHDKATQQLMFKYLLKPNQKHTVGFLMDALFGAPHGGLAFGLID